MVFICLYLFFFFFFQAEDGIRDVAVTGVQTVLFRSAIVRVLLMLLVLSFKILCATGVPGQEPDSIAILKGRERSEERRVGKECRSRWSADHEKKNGR